MSQLRRAASRSETAFSTPSSNVSDLHAFRFRTTDNQVVGLLVNCSPAHHQIQYSLMSAVNLAQLDCILQSPTKYDVYRQGRHAAKLLSTRSHLWHKTRERRCRNLQHELGRIPLAGGSATLVLGTSVMPLNTLDEVGLVDFKSCCDMVGGHS